LRDRRKSITAWDKTVSSGEFHGLMGGHKRKLHPRHSNALKFKYEMQIHGGDMIGFMRLFWICSLFAGALAVSQAQAQDSKVAQTLDLPVLNLAPASRGNEAKQPLRTLTLAAKLTEEGDPLGQGLVWRIFKPDAGQDDKLPLIATAKGGTSAFELEPGSYLVHAAFGRAGITKRITLDNEARKETLVLDAGGLKLSATLAGGLRIPPESLRFSIYQGEESAEGERPLIIPDVKPDTIIRLNSGTYHIVSTYGSVNAIIRTDINVEAGKLTEATVEHKAAELTLKLVRNAGGEAMADTAWSVVNPSGEIIKESVGAFASMVLSEGDYTIIAKNKDKLYQKDFTVVAGQNADVEVVAGE
jgi:hypothetical protein